METPSSPGLPNSGLPRRWREETVVPIQPTPPSKEGSRMGKAFLILGFMRGVLGAIGGVLSWLGPVPSPYFLPLWITEYQARPIPFLAMAERDLESMRS